MKEFIRNMGEKVVGVLVWIIATVAALICFILTAPFIIWFDCFLSEDTRPRFWWIRRRAYRKWKEEKEKEEQEFLLRQAEEKRERQKKIAAGEIIEMNLGPGVPATAFEINNYVTLAVDTLASGSNEILGQLRRILEFEHVTNTWVGEGVFHIETDFVKALDLVSFLNKKGVYYVRVLEQHWTSDLIAGFGVR